MDTRAARRPRHRALVVVAVAVAALLLSGCLTAEQGQVQSALNASRQQHGRAPLGIHRQAQAKAQAWAERLARENRLYHSTLRDGITDRWCSLAENVGYGASVQSVQNAYMGSSGHRANVLSTAWNGVGVGHARNGDRVFTVHVFIRTC